MVTHEPDIAMYTRRNVVMRDGLVQSDRAVAQPFNAKIEAQKLKDIDEPAEM